jgi:glycolate oxidase FAD binding subunit
MPDQSGQLVAVVQEAFANKTPLDIRGAGTKKFLGSGTGEPLDITPHSGIIEYDPAELVIVARAGTRLRELEETLAESGQMLGFEPPFADDGATLGGTVAAGLSGPRRVFSGAARDFMLGARFINGRGEVITSGGKVFKNVAGFDLFRPLCRSMGTLGVILDCALRVLPMPEAETTLVHAEQDESGALEKIRQWSGELPGMSAAAWDGHHIRIRLSGSAASIEYGRDILEGDWLTDSTYWRQLKNLELPFFGQHGRLWRVCVAPMSQPLNLEGNQLIDWAGAQRWLKSMEKPETIRARASELGGYAECYDADEDIGTFHPLAPGLMRLHQRIKQSMDPAGIFNRKRLYPEL